MGTRTGGMQEDKTAANLGHVACSCRCRRHRLGLEAQIPHCDRGCGRAGRAQMGPGGVHVQARDPSLQALQGTRLGTLHLLQRNGGMEKSCERLGHRLGLPASCPVGRTQCGPTPGETWRPAPRAAPDSPTPPDRLPRRTAQVGLQAPSTARKGSPPGWQRLGVAPVVPAVTKVAGEAHLMAA